MDLEITEQEKNLLLDLIESGEKETIQGVDHANSRIFKEELRKRLDLLASLRQKITTSGK